MDEADTDGEVVDAVEGVTLRKRYDAAEFHQPAVVYEFTSDRDRAVSLRVIETIPEALALEDVGFLGSSMDRTWEIKGPKLVFETELEANESFTTACAARGESADAIADLLGHPDAFEVSPPVDEPESEGALTRSAGGAETGEPIPSPDADDGSDAPASREPSDAPTSHEPDASAGREPVVEQFVEELRAGDVSSESVAFLREELGTSRPPRSIETRLKQLQADLADVRAYTNALEAFIDDHGTADDIINGLEGRLDAVEETIAGVEETVDGHDANLDRLQADLDDLDAEVDALAREFDDLGDHLDTVRGDVDRVDERLPDDLDERLTALEEELADVSRFTNSLRSAFEE